MSKMAYWIIFIGIALLMTCLFVMSKTIWKQYLWLNDLIGLIGVLLSLGGVVMALIQISQADVQIRLSAQEIDTISKDTEKIKLAVEQNREEIRDFLSISEIVHLEESIRNAQAYVIQGTYSVAVHLMQTIKDNLIRSQSQFDFLIIQLEINMTDIIKNINIDIDTLTQFGIARKKKGENGTGTSIHPDYIHRHLEAAREAAIKIESSLKQKKI